jgi:D-cysteine desulfhydrase
LIIDFNNAGIIPSTIVHATGSGGTQAGLIAGKHLYQLDCAIHSYAVCDSASYFESKVLSDLNNWKKDFQISIDLNQLIISTNDNYIGAGYGKACKEIYDTIKLVASLEGVVLDPVYSGKAFYGMLEEIKAGRYDNHSDIVFIHTGGIFGLLAEHDQIIF